MLTLAALTMSTYAVSSPADTPDADAMLVTVLEEVRSNVVGAVIAFAIAVNTLAEVAAEDRHHRPPPKAERLYFQPG
jgi:hypothetical protein